MEPKISKKNREKKKRNTQNKSHLIELRAHKDTLFFICIKHSQSLKKKKGGLALPIHFFSPWPSNSLGHKSAPLIFLFKRLQLCLYGKGSLGWCCWLCCLISFALFFSRLSWKKRGSSSSPRPHLFLSAHLCTLHYRMECHLCKFKPITKYPSESMPLLEKTNPDFFLFKSKYLYLQKLKLKIKPMGFLRSPTANSCLVSEKIIKIPIILHFFLSENPQPDSDEK